ncbi:hypothetical protein HY417_03225 [Candidatus Kaiserbacteria bacterium]|nr:hypothetical protein [Candidatus Kaiserbacteria bacterium]
MQRTILLVQLAVLTALATVHIIALANDLYWLFPSLDLLTHFLGGVWSALFFYWVMIASSRSPSVLSIIAYVLVLGVAWEVFELTVGISAGAHYARDTLSDLFMDFVGACVVVFALRYFFADMRV